MGLVDYASSDSESEAPPKQPPPTTSSSSSSSKPSAAAAKKPFQKVVDRSNPGKILVNLPSTAGGRDDEPPAKRARTGPAAASSGGGRFSGFNSFLPAPKNPNRLAGLGGGGFSASKPRPGVNLQTGAAPAFSRDGDEGGDGGGSQGGVETGMSLPPPKKQAEPSIPEGQKPADEVKLVGKPMMFRPLSVSRTKKKKTTKPSGNKSTLVGASTLTSSKQTDSLKPETTNAPVPAPKKVSLFSMHTDEPADAPDVSQGSNDGRYEPLIHTTTTEDPDQYANYTNQAPDPSTTTAAQSTSLDSIADDLNLSATARRELFGRDGGGKMAKNVINFNMDQEYRHNEEIRASGEQQLHKPVHSIQAAGKNSLSQLVKNVQSQREALEDSFAKGRSNRKEASNRYGW